MFSNTVGPHGVGMSVVQQYDRARAYKSTIDLATGEPVQGERARPVQALVWYPAVGGGTPLTYRQYMETIPTADAFSRSSADVKRMTDYRIDANAGARRDAVLREMARPLHAVRDARAENGSFPVVIYAPSYSADAIENVDLCEYLASQGYIVLSSPSMGAHTRSMTTDLEGVETQAADISYLIGYAGTLPHADAGRVAVVGFSWGGLANVFAAAKDTRIKALVSLDGSLRSFPQLTDGGKDASPYVTPARVALPLLYVGARPKTVEALNGKVGTAYSFMNEMKYSDVYILSMLPMVHPNFSSFALRMAADSEFGEYTRAEAELAHSWMARYTLHFLDAYLKGDAAGRAFIDNKPAANGAPPHMIIADTRRSKGAAPPTFETFVAQLATEGFDHAIGLYDRLTVQTPAFKLDADQIYAWGAQLFYLNRPAQAREVFRLGVHLNPANASMYDGLGEMQAKTGQTREAVASYKKVLELDPDNADAIKYVKEHGNEASS
jgi:dienelactone hydrolase